MSRDIGFSVADDIRDYLDFYADLHGTTASAMAKKALFGYVNKHPLKPTQLDEYVKRYDEVPLAFGAVRAVRSLPIYSSSLNSPKNQESIQDKKELEDYAEGVKMTKVAYSALCAKYDKATIDLAIAKVSAQQIKTGKHYPSPRGAILQWGIRAALEEIKKAGPPKDKDYCPECHIAGGNHGAFCSRKPA